MEMILASAICGCVYSLTAGQPLTILGATGPMLVFEEIVYSFSTENDIDYMPFRVWIGLWTALYCIILVATDASALIGLFTRFTEETFSILISFIFIYEAFVKIANLEVTSLSCPLKFPSMLRRSSCTCLPAQLRCVCYKSHCPPNTNRIVFLVHLVFVLYTQCPFHDLCM